MAITVMIFRKSCKAVWIISVTELSSGKKKKKVGKNQQQNKTRGERDFPMACLH